MKYLPTTVSPLHAPLPLRYTKCGRLVCLISCQNVQIPSAFVFLSACEQAVMLANVENLNQSANSFWVFLPPHPPDFQVSSAKQIIENIDRVPFRAKLQGCVWSSGSLVWAKSAQKYAFSLIKFEFFGCSVANLCCLIFTVSFKIVVLKFAWRGLLLWLQVHVVVDTKFDIVWILRLCAWLQSKHSANEAGRDFR